MWTRGKGRRAKPLGVRGKADDRAGYGEDNKNRAERGGNARYCGGAERKNTSEKFF